MTLRVDPIGMSIIKIVLFDIFVLFCCSTAKAQEKAQEAWWLGATFQPNQTTYLSLPASDIDPSWSFLAPLSFDTLPKDAASDLVWMKRSRFQFSWEGKLDHNGLSDRVVTGVYKAEDNTTGRFLLVLEKSKSGKWQKKFLYKEPGPPGFSVIRITTAGIFWNTCMLCSGFRQIVRTANSFRLD